MSEDWNARKMICAARCATYERTRCLRSQGGVDLSWLREVYELLSVYRGAGAGPHQHEGSSRGPGQVGAGITEADRDGTRRPERAR